MHKQEAGITLIELMITVAIVAILAAIAYPSYTNQIRKSNRSVAKTALLTLSQSLEKCFTQNSTYAGCAAVTGVTNTSTFDSGKNLYALNIDVPDATSFEITATAQNAQAGDANCAEFSITNTGRQEATDGSGTTCWH